MGETGQEAKWVSLCFGEELWLRVTTRLTGEDERQPSHTNMVGGNGRKTVKGASGSS